MAAVQLCPLFLVGSCQYGTTCRRSHDMDAFLAAKQPDLPGSCPFACLPSCPHGLGCRWAATHTDGTGDTVLTHAAAAAAEGAAAEGAAAKPISAETAAAEAAEGMPAADCAAEASGAAVAAASAAGAAAAAAAVSANGAAPSAALAAAANVPGDTDAAWLARLSPACLSRPSSIAKPLNAMPMEVQQQLRRQCYDFRRSDEVLVSLGLQVGASWQGVVATAVSGGNTAAGQ